MVLFGWRGMELGSGRVVLGSRQRKNPEKKWEAVMQFEHGLKRQAAL